MPGHSMSADVGAPKTVNRAVGPTGDGHRLGVVGDPVDIYGVPSVISPAVNSLARTIPDGPNLLVGILLHTSEPGWIHMPGLSGQTWDQKENGKE